jgi:single-strand DNA-binding protein
VAFGKTADLASQYVQKGSQLLVEGYLRTRSWEAQDGKKYRTEIVIDRMEFIGKKVDREEPEDLPF